MIDLLLRELIMIMTDLLLPKAMIMTQFPCNINDLCLKGILLRELIMMMIDPPPKAIIMT
jgi:hypothetical protein